MAGEKDSRVVVGGAVWARAEAISRDYKRILGNQFKTKWIGGVVVRVEKRKTTAAGKRATTYVTGKFPCGKDDTTKQVIYKEKELSLQTLKDRDPNAVEPSTVTNNVAPPPTAIAETATAETATGTETSVEPTTNTTQEEVPIPTPAEPDVEQPRLPITVNVPPASATTNTSSLGSQSAGSRFPVVTVNDRHWYEGDTNVDVNGKHSARFWKVVDQYGRGHEFTPGCDRSKDPKFRPIDYFMTCFPKAQLQQMVDQTNKSLEEAFPDPLPPITMGELLRFFGVLLIITRFEFGARASLWTDTAYTRFVPPPNLGHTTGMPRNRFDQLWRHIVWSEQPKERPEGVSHEQWRWMLIQDFVDNFNAHREEFFSPSWLLCADESISRWYGLGGNWINIGLPHYVAMDRKPEHGCEIQNCCDAMSGIMLRLKLVKSQAAEESITQEQRTAAAAAEAT